MENPNSKTIYFIKKSHFLLGYFFLFWTGLFCQNQKLADSLEVIYTANNFKEQDRLNILQKLAIEHADPEKKLTFSIELIKTAQALDSLNYLYSGYVARGNALRIKGDLSLALDSYFQAAKIAIEENSNHDLGITHITIADVYSNIGNHANAIHYYQSAIDILRKENDSLDLAAALYNAGDEYFNIKKYDSAKLHFNESSIIYKNNNNLMGTAYNQGSIGMIYAEQGNYVLAKHHINQAISILEKLELYSPISEFLTYMSDIYANQNDLKTAFSYSYRSLELAKKYGLKKQICDTNLKLSELYEQDGNLPESFKYYKNHIAYRDSVTNIESVQQMANVRTDFEVSQKQLEVDLLNQQKRNQKP